MEWAQIAQVVPRTIDRLHGFDSETSLHQDRRMGRPTSMLKMPFATDKLPGGPLA